jgi:D-alanine-D-alanine ligase
MKRQKKSVLVLYNHTGSDEYEALRKIDRASLGFIPKYDIDVATDAEEYEAIVQALRAEGFNARAINIRDDLRKLNRLLKVNPPDAVFNLVEHWRDDPRLEEAVAGFFELHDIPFTGAPPFTLGLCRRKGLTKQILLQNGIATPRYLVQHSTRVPRRHGLRYPLIVKPARQDASYGVTEKSVVRDYRGLVSQVERVIEDFSPPVLVEEFLGGTELHVSILGNDPPEALPVVEFDFSELPSSHPAVITYDVKWSPLSLAYHRVHTYCPARISAEARERVHDLALQAYAATCCRDYARVDIRLNERGEPHVLEVNPNPNLTEGVSFMESAEKSGISFSQALKRIVELALQRGR